MNPEGLQTQTSQPTQRSSFGQLADKVRRAWQTIYQRVAPLIKGGVSQLLFMLDKGAATTDDALHRENVCSAIHAIYGDSPAEQLIQTPLEDRERFIAGFHITIAQALGIDVSSVASAALGGSCGVYLWDCDTLIVNQDELCKQPLTPEEAKNVLDTILHETYHSFQRKAVVRPSQYNITRADAQIWRINFQNYIAPEQNPEQYWRQPLESSARAFAATVMNRLYPQL